MRQLDRNDENDLKDLAELRAEPWQAALLDLNPEYPHWGPGEDYMSVQKDGWDAAKLFESWKEFGPWPLDELNEVVNFYFAVRRTSDRCDACLDSIGCATGYNPETRKISEDFYDFAGTGRRWIDKITEDEVEALISSHRIGVKFNPKTSAYERTLPAPTAAEINAANAPGARSFAGPGVRSHDAINRSILIETRAKRLGVYGLCEKCEGRGSVFTDSEAHVELTLWFLHPRKGCSRGVRVERIEREDLPKVFVYLREAAERNAARFQKVVGL